MSLIVEFDDCERCGDRVDALRRLCPECARVVRDAREGPL
jgi:predicted amidophosphoribosyltransferase